MRTLLLTLASAILFCALAVRAHAAPITVVCGEDDKYSGSEPWTFYIDQDAKTVSRSNLGKMVSFPASIADQFIEWTDFAPVSFRIDRFAGNVTQSGTPWGVISRKCRAATTKQF